MGKQLTYCELCNSGYTPCRFNHSRQKYCTLDECIRQRSKKRQAAWRAKWKAAKGSTYDEGRLRPAKKESSKSSIPPSVREGKPVTATNERMFAEGCNTLDILMDTIETQHFIICGVGVMLGGGDAQTLAQNQGDVIDRWYESGRSLVEASPLINNIQERFNEIRNQNHYGASTTPNSLPVQLAGSAAGT